MTEAEIKENYNFPFKISTSDDIFTLAEKKDKNSLYLKIGILYKGDIPLINFMIIDCETGKTLSRCHMGGLTKVSFNAPSNNHLKNQAFFNESLGRPNHYYGTGLGLIGPEIARIYTKKYALKKHN